MYKSSSIVFFQKRRRCLPRRRSIPRNFPSEAWQQRESCVRDTKWDQLGTLLPARYKGQGGRRGCSFFFFCLLSPFANFASRLSPPTILSTVRTVSVSCVGRLACFNHRPPRPLRSPLFFFSFFLSFSHFFTPPSPPSNVGLMEVISTFPVKLARIGFILTSRVIIVKRVREFAWKRFGRI